MKLAKLVDPRNKEKDPVSACTLIYIITFEVLSQKILTNVVNNIMLLFSAPLKGSCWFCLGSPQVEKHLVVSVGDDVSANQLINCPWSTSKSDRHMLSVRRNVSQTVINRSATGLTTTSLVGLSV